MSEHTSTPWEVLEVGGQHFIAAKPYEGHQYYNRTTTIEVLSDEDYPTREADVRFIVEACNAYDDLVAKVAAQAAEIERINERTTILEGTLLTDEVVCELEHEEHQEEVRRLEKQLAEKDAEIERVKVKACDVMLQVISEELEACVKACEDLAKGRGILDKRLLDEAVNAIRSRGRQSIKLML